MSAGEALPVAVGAWGRQVQEARTSLVLRHRGQPFSRSCRAVRAPPCSYVLCFLPSDPRGKQASPSSSLSTPPGPSLARLIGLTEEHSGQAWVSHCTIRCLGLPEASACRGGVFSRAEQAAAGAEPLPPMGFDGGTWRTQLSGGEHTSSNA